MPPAADRRFVARTPTFRGLRRWLALVWILGAVTPCSHAEPPEVADSSLYGIQVESFHRDHWSFRPIQPEVIPNGRDAQSPNPIDGFVERNEDNRYQ